MEKTPIPAGLTVFMEECAVIIRRQSGVSGKLWLLPLSLLTLVFHRFTFSPGDEWQALQMLGELAPAIISAYVLLCSSLNRTDVIVSPSRVQVRSTPIPWWGDRCVNAQDIYGLVFREGREGEDGAKFRLYYLDRGGKERPLGVAGKKKEEVEFIGRAIGEIIGMEMRPAERRGFFALPPRWLRFKKTTPAGEPVATAPMLKKESL